MRAGARTVALTALGMWTFACAVYQADEIPLGGRDEPVSGGGGSASGAGGRVGQGGVSPAAAGRAGDAPLGGSEGMGKTGVSTAIALSKLATGRYLLIKQQGSSLSWWSTQEVEVSCSE